MFDIGFFELLFITIIALLVLGPERLPSTARAVGSWVGQAKRMMKQLSVELDREIETQELKQELLKQMEDSPPDQLKS